MTEITMPLAQAYRRVFAGPVPWWLWGPPAALLVVGVVATFWPRRRRVLLTALTLGLLIGEALLWVRSYPGESLLLRFFRVEPRGVWVMELRIQSARGGLDLNLIVQTDAPAWFGPPESKPNPSLVWARGPALRLPYPDHQAREASALHHPFDAGAHAGPDNELFWADHSWWLTVPHWSVVTVIGLLLLLPLRQVVRRRRRVRRGLCPVCGYDLRATPEGCPECGTPANPRRGDGAALES